MAKIQHKDYIILDFKDVTISVLKICLGVLGYLFIQRESKYKTSYVPSRFIQPFNLKCKIDLIKYLIDHSYIIKCIPPTDPKDIEVLYPGIKKRYDENYKKKANVYLLTIKLRNLGSQYLNEPVFSIFIDKQLHHLDNQYFNHYYWSYRNIQIVIPHDKTYLLETHQLTHTLKWGDRTIKDYDISEFGYDNYEWAGTHINIFNFVPKELIQYTSLGEVVEVAPYNFRPLLLADQLFKTIGENDYSDFFKKSRFEFKTSITVKTKDPDAKVIADKTKDKNIIVTTKKKYTLNKLFILLNEYNIFDKVSYLEFYNAIFGFEHIKEFANFFPQATDLLYKIKNAGRTYDRNFFKFTSNLQLKIFKNDIRLELNENHPAFARGQAYYKIVPLVIMIREVEIMRQIWIRLKKVGITFIPMQNSVVVSKEDVKAVTYITEEVLKYNIHKSLKFVVTQEPIK